MTPRLFLALSLALSLSACASEKEEDSGGAADADCSTDGLDGASIYATNCAGCHAADGSGASGPSLQDAMPNSSDTEVLDVIGGGSGGMPAFDGTLDCGQQDVLLEYLRDQHGAEGGA